LEPWLGYLKFVYCVVGVLFAFVRLVRFMHRHRRVRAGRSTMARRWNKLGWRPEAVVKYLFKRKRTAAVPLKFTDKVLTCSLARSLCSCVFVARQDRLAFRACSFQRHRLLFHAAPTIRHQLPLKIRNSSSFAS